MELRAQRVYWCKRLPAQTCWTIGEDLWRAEKLHITFISPSSNVY